MTSTIDPNESNGGSLIATAAVFLVLTYISVGLRAIVRGWLTKSFLADDWLMMASQVNFTLSCIFIIVGVRVGLGRHNSALPQNQEIQALKWQALATMSYVLNMMLIKLSIAVFLLRLSAEKKYRYTIWASAVVVFVWSTVLFFWNLFQCRPVEAQWDSTIPGGSCVASEEIVRAALALSAMTILSDFFYALVPIPIIWKVKMTTQAKATVVGILGLGIFASIATLIRLKFLADLNDTADILFSGTDAMVWTLIEPGLAIMASSLATIRPLLRKLRLPGFTSTVRTGPSNRSAYGYGYGYGRNKSGGPLVSVTNRSVTSRSVVIGSGGSGSGSGSDDAGAGAGGGRMMPGFGPGDLPLTDLEAGGGVVVAAGAGAAGARSLNEDDGAAPNGGGGRRRSFAAAGPRQQQQATTLDGRRGVLVTTTTTITTTRMSPPPTTTTAAAPSPLPSRTSASTVSEVGGGGSRGPGARRAPARDGSGGSSGSGGSGGSRRGDDSNDSDSVRRLTANPASSGSSPLSETYVIEGVRLGGRPPDDDDDDDDDDGYDDRRRQRRGGAAAELPAGLPSHPQRPPGGPGLSFMPRTASGMRREAAAAAATMTTPTTGEPAGVMPGTPRPEAAGMWRGQQGRPLA